MPESIEWQIRTTTKNGIVNIGKNGDNMISDAGVLCEGICTLFGTTSLKDVLIPKIGDIPIGVVAASRYVLNGAIVLKNFTIT